MTLDSQAVRVRHRWASGIQFISRVKLRKLVVYNDCVKNGGWH